jgi:hypothetical protein
MQTIRAITITITTTIAINITIITNSTTPGALHIAHTQDITGKTVK